ncbi:DEAD-box ATP-dependent RNA helicase 32-like [Pyrus ussuriensis x Pyrus communis]|uniref:ATP-dependent RNA helicase n=1 Tax=Pyrus ussuriensis x Pyrus communis TaxID=2448454 RepID=A0A5N5HR06_9ROSA|nr:DEAD-box ATP-dependent RNA helicase 32-like [Pyrus ussuriensis x Pyrus communis]
MRKLKSTKSRIQSQHSELHEIELLKSWIESQQPERGSNPMSLPALPSDARAGRLDSTRFSRYAGATRFDQLPISKKTKDALRQCNKYVQMSDIQRACLPHALCGRDVRGAAKTGSGKTLAFVIPIVEKLYRGRWCPQDGVGSIVISPTREIASQTFDVLRLVGRHHSFSAALLIGGRRGKDVQVEKELVNECNILVCTPGRLLQHMDETPHFDCSQLQVFVLDEVDSMLSDPSFKQTMNAIISQLPKQRQTLLFSATHPKDVKDLAVLCLKDPEFLSVHEKSVTATPNKLRQTFVIVPLHQKLDMLWSFIKRNLKSRILVFLSTRKQVQFVCEAFKMLSPTITWMALYGKLDQRRRMATVSEFSNQPSVLFSTDVASRGLDFNQGVDWVVQVDCPGDVASYIHRVGRTARFDSVGKSLLFLMPSEEKMLEKLQAANIPIREIKPNKNVGQSVSGKLANFIVQYPGLLHARAQSALKTYLKSVTKKDKEIFDVTKLPIDEFSASIGLASTPRIRFLSNKIKSSSKKASELSPVVEPELLDKDHELELLPKEELDLGASSDEERDKDPRPTNDTAHISPPCTASTRVSKKKKKLKINIHRPVGTRVVFDEEGNTLPPLARLADISNASGLLDQIQDKKNEYYKKLREGLKKVDKDDKVVDGHRRREKRLKDKIRSQRGDTDEEPEEEEEEDVSDSEGEPNKRLLLSNC